MKLSLLSVATFVVVANVDAFSTSTLRVVAPTAMKTTTSLRSSVTETESFFPAVTAEVVNGAAAAVEKVPVPSPAPVVAVPAPAPAVTIVDSSVNMLNTPEQTYQLLAKKGEANAKASTLKTFVSATLGGCYVGMGGMLSLAVAGNMMGVAGTNPGLAKLMFAILFPVNLWLALLAGGQLFTGNTANMAAAICEKKATIKDLARSWSVSFIGNVVGCASFAIACKYAGVLSGGPGLLAAKTLAGKVSLSLGPLFVRAMLCNWLVCLAVYMSMMAKDMVGKYVSILLPISTFVSIGFEHSVANLFLLPAGLLCSTAGITLKQAIFNNIIPVAIGNAISGSLFVGVLFSFMFGRLGKDK